MQGVDAPPKRSSRKPVGTSDGILKKGKGASLLCEERRRRQTQVLSPLGCGKKPFRGKKSKIRSEERAA